MDGLTLTDEQTDRRTDGWTDQQTEGLTEGLTDRPRNTDKYRFMNRQTSGPIDRQTEGFGLADKQTNGKTQ